jgi:multiple sugar transport system permease protein
VRPPPQRLGRQEVWAAAGFLAVPLAYFALFHLLPVAINLWVSLHAGLPLIAPGQPFVGLGNFRRLVDDSVFLASLRTSGLFAAGATGGSVVLGLSLALALNRNLRLRSLLRAIIVFPYMTSMAIITLIFLVIFNPEIGVLNFLLYRLGLPAVPWLTSPTMALVSLIIVSVWWETGFNMVIFLAGLTAIPDEYFEAARIDGAGALAQFRHVLLPLLAPTTFFVVVFSLIHSFQAFTQPFVLTQGGPAYATNLVVYHIYQVAFTHLDLGYASAMALVVFAIVLGATGALFRVWRGAGES